jgi:hypothetical protein
VARQLRGQAIVALRAAISRVASARSDFATLTDAEVSEMTVALHAMADRLEKSK